MLSFIRPLHFDTFGIHNSAGLHLLTLPAPIPDKEKKINLNFFFTLLCGASKGFMKALKAFLKCTGREGLTRLRLVLSHVNEHKFKYNFHVSRNLICACILESETTQNYLLRLHSKWKG